MMKRENFYAINCTPSLFTQSDKARLATKVDQRIKNKAKNAKTFSLKGKEMRSTALTG